MVGLGAVLGRSWGDPGWSGATPFKNVRALVPASSRTRTCEGDCTTPMVREVQGLCVNARAARARAAKACAPRPPLGFNEFYGESGFYQFWPGLNRPLQGLNRPGQAGAGPVPVRSGPAIRRVENFSNFFRIFFPGPRPVLWLFLIE